MLNQTQREGPVVGRGWKEGSLDSNKEPPFPPWGEEVSLAIPQHTQGEAALRQMGTRVRSRWSLLAPMWTLLKVLPCLLHPCLTPLPSLTQLPSGPMGSAESLEQRKEGGGDEMALTDPRQIWGEGTAGGIFRQQPQEGGEMHGSQAGVCAAPILASLTRLLSWAQPSAPCLALNNVPLKGLDGHLPQAGPPCVSEGFLSTPPITEGG